MTYEHGSRAKRMPKWLVRPLARTHRSNLVRGVLDEHGLHTVCESAKCPNRSECFGSGTATFLLMGDVCTRSCSFCAVDSGDPMPLDCDEPRRVARAAARLGLGHVVVTSVTRDDLSDGGADHFAATVRELRRALPEASIEVLTSDFGGKLDSVDVVVEARPDVFNHNVETVPRLYSSIRPQADYARSLRVLERAKVTGDGTPTKSGLMLGLGESIEEVLGVMGDLRRVGCDWLTLGQYLRPSPAHAEVIEFVEPDTFAFLEREARHFGFASVASAPLVRSSYRARDMFE